MTNLELGNKIRQFRTAKGLSQMNLELEINAAPGSLSRIESGKINPTKETLGKISQALNLNSLETADLFDLKLVEYTRIFANATAAVNSTLDIEEVCQLAVDKLINELGLLSGFIVVREGNNLYSRAASTTKVAELSMKVIRVPFNSLHVSLTKDLGNLMVRTVLDKKYYIGEKLREFVVPAVNPSMAIILEKISNAKSLISLPMIIKDECIGAIMFGKDREDKIWTEKEILMAFTDQVAVAIKNAEEYEKIKKQLDTWQQIQSN